MMSSPSRGDSSYEKGARVDPGHARGARAVIREGSGGRFPMPMQGGAGQVAGEPQQEQMRGNEREVSEREFAGIFRVDPRNETPRN